MPRSDCQKGPKLADHQKPLSCAWTLWLIQAPLRDLETENRQRCNFALRHRANFSLTHSLRGGHAMAGCAA